MYIVYIEKTQAYRSKIVKTFSRILAILLFSLAIPQILTAAIAMPEEETVTIRRGIELLYNLEYDAAITNFASLLPKWQDHPAPWFFTAMVWWIKCSQDDDVRRSGDLFNRNIDVAISKARALLARNPTDAAGIFYLAGSLGFAGRHAFMANDILRAVRTGWEAYQLLRNNENAFDENKDVLLGHGIFNFYAGRLPASARGIARILGVEGDWRLGLEQLKQVMDEGIFARTEAEYTLSHIYTYDLRDGVMGARFSRNLMERYPRNPEFRLQYSENLLSSGRTAEAREAAEQGLALIENGTYKTIPLFRFYCLLGKIAHSERNHEETLRWLNLAIDTRQKSSGNYLAWAHVRRGDAHLNLNNRRAAQADFRRAIDLDAGGSAATAAEQRLSRMN
jgi:tetratricopeptide (TPR) repeat protein